MDVRAKCITSSLATIVKYVFQTSEASSEAEAICFFHTLLSRPFILIEISSSRQKSVMKINATFPDSVLQQCCQCQLQSFKSFGQRSLSTTSCHQQDFFLYSFSLAADAQSVIHQFVRLSSCEVVQHIHKGSFVYLKADPFLNCLC